MHGPMFLGKAGMLHLPASINCTRCRSPATPLSFLPDEHTMDTSSGLKIPRNVHASMLVEPWINIGLLYSSHSRREFNPVSPTPVHRTCAHEEANAKEDFPNSVASRETHTL
eukprot:GHVU01105044.1.p1 GENE.GHVU01105044.1~~GHVU01105044.1.p1  ORF type:complete len:112 (+),score=6.54 GHVU01105044.1:150-485(+)